jgi:hypothetical protein
MYSSSNYIDFKKNGLIIGFMDISTIANKNGVTSRFIYFILKGERHTDNVSLAMDLAEATGNKPMDYITPSLRKVLKVHLPYLNRKVK